MSVNQIHSSFQHGKNFEIGYFCVIEEDVVVGDNVKIDNFVLLKKGTRIGDNVWVDSYVRSSGDNYIGNDVTLRFGSTIARKVNIGDGAFVSPNVMTIYSKHTGEKSKSTNIGRGVFLGTAAVIGPNVSICDNAVVGVMTFVNKDIVIPGTYVGNPAYKKK